MTNIYVNEFVRRQTKKSRFSHFEGSEQDLLNLVDLSKGVQGYREGVLEVQVEPEGFYSGVIQLTENAELTAKFERRKSDEDPRKTIAAVGGQKLPAKAVTIILYSSELLAMNGDNNFEGGWEIISINASPTLGKEPMNPQTLMANHFGASGGTETNLPDGEFIALLEHSFNYWKDKAMAG